MSSREHPILFSAPMVRAILDGRKTMTRRVVDRDLWDCLDDGVPSDQQIIETDDTPMGGVPATWFCPYGYPGDMLWVRETWRVWSDETPSIEYKAGDYRTTVHYPGAWRSYCDEYTKRNGPANWRPSIHMPRWASRITLEVTAVKVERVQDITGEDAMAEGVLGHGGDKSRALTEFMVLWNKINESRGYGWSVNPWVFAVAFRRVIG